MTKEDELEALRHIAIMAYTAYVGQDDLMLHRMMKKLEKHIKVRMVLPDVCDRWQLVSRPVVVEGSR